MQSTEGRCARLPVLEEAAFPTKSDDSVCRRLHNLLDICIRKHRGGYEDWLVVTIDVDAVEHEDMEMGVEVEG